MPASLLVYILGLRLLTSNFVMIFIITILLLAMDFYYLKNIAGRRLVGLRWWNEVDTATGDGRWVFESADPETRELNATGLRCTHSLCCGCCWLCWRWLASSLFG